MNKNDIDANKSFRINGLISELIKEMAPAIGTTGTTKDYVRMEISTLMDFLFEWRSRWLEKIPYISFPENWKVKIIPPYLGMVCRFQVKDENGEWASVFLDGYDMFGTISDEKEPYWEVYPIEEDIERFPMNDTDGLIESIKNEFNRRQSNDCAKS